MTGGSDGDGDRDPADDPDDERRGAHDEADGEAGAASDENPNGEDDRWIRLGHVNWQMALAVAAPTFLIVAVLPYNFVGLATKELPLWARLLLVALAIVVANAIGVLVARLRTPQVFVNPMRRSIRTRGVTVAWSELDFADLIALESKRKRTLILVVRAGKRLRAPLLLRTAQEKPIDEQTQALAAAVIRGSSIAMPISKDDPTGRFARFNFPTSVTKDEALDLVLRPPAFGEPIPIPAAR